MITVPYDLGAVGVEQVASADITKADTTVEIISLPANCLITRVIAEVTEAFNAATTNVLTVGTNVDVNDLLGEGDVNESASGFYESATVKAKKLTAAATVKAKYAYTGTAPTTGKATIYVFFVRLQP
ncbi:MAG TPA: hypothetical protein GXX40_05665 [Firmicutes bacterium]|nr:hypothetical protein [Bacillota bacterium]